MSNSNETISPDKTGWAIPILIGIGSIIVGCYFFNFNSHILQNESWWKVFQNLSADTGNWGTFGDYVGGILNPVIAAFAFYLIAETYKLQTKAYDLQKTELEETRKLLKVSTDAQNDQVKLAALTALLNSNFTRISSLTSEKTELFKQQDIVESNIFPPEHFMAQDQRDHLSEIRRMLIETENKINELKEKNNRLEGQIEVFGEEKIE